MNEKKMKHFLQGSLRNVSLRRGVDYSWMRRDCQVADHGYTNLRQGQWACECHIKWVYKKRFLEICLIPSDSGFEKEPRLSRGKSSRQQQADTGSERQGCVPLSTWRRW